MASVEFKNVSKRFGLGMLALQHIDLKLNDGEFLVLVGPSGCGKSTILRLLAGLEHVSKGKILINDEVVNGLSPQKRNVAMVFQNYALYPHMSVRENLEFPLRMMKLPEDEITRRAQTVAELLHLAEMMEQRPGQLSGGQRQRVAMGRAIVREPRVFLMDEPLSNLDAKLRVQIRSEIAALQKRLNITTLYVTHDQVEAMTLGQRVAVMNNGRLQQVDTPRALYERPMNVFVARFIGNPGMNVVPCELRREGECLCFDFADQTLVVPENGRGSHETLNRYIGQPIFLVCDRNHLPSWKMRIPVFILSSIRSRCWVMSNYCTLHLSNRQTVILLFACRIQTNTIQAILFPYESIRASCITLTKRGSRFTINLMGYVASLDPGFPDYSISSTGVSGDFKLLRLSRSKQLICRSSTPRVCSLLTMVSSMALGAEI